MLNKCIFSWKSLKPFVDPKQSWWARKTYCRKWIFTGHTCLTILLQTLIAQLENVHIQKDNYKIIWDNIIYFSNILFNLWILLKSIVLSVAKELSVLQNFLSTAFLWMWCNAHMLEVHMLIFFLTLAVLYCKGLEKE